MADAVVSDALIFPRDEGLPGVSDNEETWHSAGHVAALAQAVDSDSYVRSDSELAFSGHDGTNDTVDVTAGLAYVDLSGETVNVQTSLGGNSPPNHDTALPTLPAIMVEIPTTISGVALQDSTASDVWLAFDTDGTGPGSAGSVYVRSDDTGSVTAPSHPSVKLGSANPDDSSADVLSNRGPSPTFESLSADDLTITTNSPRLTWGVSRAKAPNALDSPSCAVIDGELYVAGGFDGSYLDSLYKYDPAADSWSTLASMPSTVDDGTAGSINGELYVAGGQSSSTRLDTLYNYDSAADSWSTLASMPQALNKPTAGVISGELYVAGGEDGSGTALDTLYRYDPSADSWSTLASMPGGREFPAEGVIDGELYVAGGFDGSGRQDTLYKYDPSADSWSTLASMPKALMRHRVGVVDGELYVVGGDDGDGFVTDAFRYNPDTDTWMLIEKCPIPTNAAGSGVIDNELFIVAGNNATSRLDTVYVFYDAVAD